MKCGVEITACNGFVLARDWLSAMDGLIPWTSVREHCGKCVTELSLLPDEGQAYLIGIQAPDKEF